MGGDHHRGAPPPATASARPHVLLLCSPCMGHLIPFTELARRLVADHGLAATVLFASATSPPSAQYLALAASAPDGVSLVALPAPPPPEDGADLSPHGLAVRAIVSCVPRVRDVARSLATAAPLAALVVDMIGVPARDVARELGAPCYMFVTSPWMLLSLLLHLPELDAASAGELRDATEPIGLPGCVPIHGHELPNALLAGRSSASYTWFMAMAKGVTGVDAILVNTFRELEPALGNIADSVTMPPVHAVGPLVWTRPVTVDRDHGCLRWLDQQPRGSVVYVSFGSGGTLTWQQMAELALGLELSRKRFIWVIRKPDQESRSGAFYGTRQGEEDTTLNFLPRGFIERTRGAGYVVQSWAPQTAILTHASTGCFMTHCGWNSMLEGVISGVPMVAWPLYAEQGMNAAMMEIQAGVATRVKVGPANFITKEEVASVVRRVMEGEEARRMRKRIGELRDKAADALSKDGGSAGSLAQIAHDMGGNLA